MVKYGVHYDGTRSFIVKVDDSYAGNMQLCDTLPQAKGEMIKNIDADIERYGEMIRLLREKRAYFENLEEGDL